MTKLSNMRLTLEFEDNSTPMKRVTKFDASLDDVPDEEKARRLDESLDILRAIMRTGIGLSPT